MGENTYAIYTLGCKVNQYDSAVVAAGLPGLGLREVRADADLVVLNTCAVTKTAISKAKYKLNRVRQFHPRAKLVLMGCWVKAYPEDIGRFSADLVWPAGDPAGLVRQIAALLGLNPKSASLGALSQDKIRYFLKVQDGCEQFCSYCVIPYTRGPLSSRQVDEVIAEAKAAAQRSSEIVLTGIHLGLYGREKKRPARTGLTGLIRQILDKTDIPRLRLSSIEITEVDDELIRLVREERRVCRHLHLSLQSASDKILALMKRPYDSRYFARRLAQIRAQVPDLAATTDVIVGFPGETEVDFEKTYEFCRQQAFSKIHVFPFSPHKKTPAWSLPGRVSANKTKARALKLRALSDRLEKDFYNKFQGQTLPVLVESIRNGQARLKTEYHFDLHLSAAPGWRSGLFVQAAVPTADR